MDWSGEKEKSVRDSYTHAYGVCPLYSNQDQRLRRSTKRSWLKIRFLFLNWHARFLSVLARALCSVHPQIATSLSHFSPKSISHSPLRPKHIKFMHIRPNMNINFQYNMNVFFLHENIIILDKVWLKIPRILTINTKKKLRPRLTEFNKLT
jgi:hypothetical protein